MQRLTQGGTCYSVEVVRIENNTNVRQPLYASILARVFSTYRASGYARFLALAANISDRQQWAPIVGAAVVELFRHRRIDVHTALSTPLVDKPTNIV